MNQEEIRGCFQSLTGNEIKILLACWWLQLEGKPSTPQAIAREAALNRATVYRLISNLVRTGYLYPRLTPKGTEIVRLILSSTAEISRQASPSPPPSPDPDYIIDSPGQVISDPLPQTSPDVAKCDTFAKCDTEPSQNATPTPPVRTFEPLESEPKGFDPVEHPNREILRHARLLAGRSIQMLQDHQSEAYHVKVWMEALEIDGKRGNREVTTLLSNLVNNLNDRLMRGNKRVGPAFTKASKQILSAQREGERK